MSHNVIKKNVNGILLLDKSVGLSSNAALQRVKKLFNAKKAGHTGSLDPLATGMLPICFGEATKFSQYLLDSDKFYRVTVKLGLKTTTGDAEGDIVLARPVVNVNRDRIVQVLSEFLGPIQQIPPMFSAIKVQGKPLYELARQGIEIERAARTVQIYHLECVNIISEDLFELDVHCSKGTYVRTLVEDIGERLACGAHVAALRRLSVTPYEQYKMYTLDMLESLLKNQSIQVLHQLLLPLESSVQRLPMVKLSTSAAFYMRTGQPVMVPHLPISGWVRLYEADLFIGVGEILEDGRVGPKRLVASQYSSNSVMPVKAGIQA